TARLGNFQPLMARSRDLLTRPRNFLTELLGNVLTVENAVAEYRKRLLESSDLLRSQRGLDALAVDADGAASKALSINDLEGVQLLSEALKLVKARVHDNNVS